MVAALAQSPALGRLRDALFGSVANTATTVAILALALWLVPPFLDWALWQARWLVSDPRECRSAAGACWAFVAERHRFMLLGTYPYGEQWRAAAAVALVVALWIATARARLAPRRLALAWVAGLGAAYVLLRGGLAGLSPVEPERWGGLVLTLILATVGAALAFPLAVLLALGRRSTLPAVRWLCIAYIELVRGVPLVSLLFMASVLLPLFLPEGVTLDKLVRAQIALVAFAAAYLAEVVRGGLQAVPRHQYEAAEALGLGYWPRMVGVILPQALRIAIPPLVNTFIGLLKDTSLVVVIGLFDLLTAVKVSLQDPAWSGFGVEAYLFASLVYFAFCGALSRWSLRLERDPATAALRIGA